MSGESTHTTVGTSLPSLLGVVFVTLKLCGVIDWSWWWVTAPFWALPAFLLLMIGAFCFLCLVGYLIEQFAANNGGRR